MRAKLLSAVFLGIVVLGLGASQASAQGVRFGFSFGPQPRYNDYYRGGHYRYDDRYNYGRYDYYRNDYYRNDYGRRDYRYNDRGFHGSWSNGRGLRFSW